MYSSSKLCRTEGTHLGVVSSVPVRCWGRGALAEATAAAAEAQKMAAAAAAAEERERAEGGG